MPAKTKPTKKTPSKSSKKSVAGSGGLKSNKRFNWKLALPLVLILASVGGYMVWKSSAASFSFSRRPQDQMSGGVARQSGGVWRRNVPALPFTDDVNAKNATQTLVSKSEITASYKICTTYVINTDMGRAGLSNVNLFYIKTWNDGSQTRARFAGADVAGAKSGERRQLCGYASEARGNVIGVELVSGASKSIGVLSIYGVR